MVNAHEESHNEAKSTLARSRSQAWIVRGYNLAKKVCQECSRCKLFHKRKAEQKEEASHLILASWACTH